MSPLEHNRHRRPEHKPGRRPKNNDPVHCHHRPLQETNALIGDLDVTLNTTQRPVATSMLASFARAGIRHFPVDGGCKLTPEHAAW